MIEAYLGILIASFASIALLISIGVTNSASKEAGRSPLSNKEKEIIKNAGYNDNEIDIINIDIQNIDLK